MVGRDRDHDREDAELEPVDPAIDAALSLDGNPEAIREHYDRWADAYDQDVGAERYALPEQVALLLGQVVALDAEEAIEGLTIDPADPELEMLDAGCGTGLIGSVLAGAGYRTIDGIDLSAAMIEQAERRGCYRRLRSGVDLTAPAPEDLRDRYDIVIAGGVFTVGHVPPTALNTVAAMTRPGGLALVTTRLQYERESGYPEVADRLERDGLIRLLRVNRDAPYTLDSRGHYWAYLVVT